MLPVLLTYTREKKRCSWSVHVGCARGWSPCRHRTFFATGFLKVVSQRGDILGESFPETEAGWAARKSGGMARTRYLQPRTV